MVAAPQYGTLVFRGLSSQNTYIVDVYVSDVVDKSVNFDEGAGAGVDTETFKTFPESVRLEDYAQVAGLTDTTRLRLVVNGAPTSQVLRHAMHLTTLNNRPRLGANIRAGSRFSILQMS